jgi:hypothetical protein
VTCCLKAEDAVRFAKRVSAETNLCRRFRGNGRESTVPEETGLETYEENLEGR